MKNKEIKSNKFKAWIRQEKMQKILSYISLSLAIIFTVFLLSHSQLGTIAEVVRNEGYKALDLLSVPTTTGLPLAVPTNAATPTIEPKPISTPIPTANTYVPPPANRAIPEEELIVAINIYRQAHGVSALSTSQALCQETRKRVQDMVTLNIGKVPGNMILNHDGMAQDVQNGVLDHSVGKKHYGENIASAYCKRPFDGAVVDVTTGTQLVEWCFDSSPGHKENLLNPQWTDVCSSGQFPFYVETFAY